MVTSLSMLTLLLATASVSHVNARQRTGVSGKGRQYRIGVGIGDITGPAAGVVMMGYAKPEMVTRGIHTRLYARTFIFCDKPASGKCVVFVNLDAGMTSEIIKTQVVSQLLREFDGVYNMQNVLISSTHTHSGPAGYLQYFLFQLANFFWIQETFESQCAGILTSIRRAHKSLSLGTMDCLVGVLHNASINRSPTAYMMNPAAERARYAFDTDKEMFLLKMFDKSGKPKGMLNWFAVHGTSMNNTNHHISGDNKGYAEQVFEMVMNKGAMPGTGGFVAAFASSNLGDVSPNIRGPRCVDTGLPCDADRSTCAGKVEKCRASGPGNDMIDSTAIIGHRQFDKAMKLFMDNSSYAITGPVDFIHQYIDMTNQHVTLPDKQNVKTCRPAMGFSFAAGTTDGPGAISFSQSDKSGSKLWRMIRDFIKKPSEELKQCHHPKPILLPTGEMKWPYSWQPSAVPVQLLRVGNLVIVGVPGEFTTMAGRRLRKAVKKRFALRGIRVQVVIAGLSNSYSDYVTTYEEYQRQRYEGASTIYGPYTHMAYVQKFVQLSDAMIKRRPMPDEAKPKNLLKKQWRLLPDVLFDTAPLLKDFGYVLTSPPKKPHPGQSVQATFVAGHPRNNPMLERSYLEILRRRGDGNWTVVATDASWSTLFTWKRTNVLLGQSEVTITWNIPENTPAGTYKIKHMGYYKPLLAAPSGFLKRILSLFIRIPVQGKPTCFYQGETTPFQVVVPSGSLFGSFRHR